MKIATSISYLDWHVGKEKSLKKKPLNTCLNPAFVGYREERRK